MRTFLAFSFAVPILRASAQVALLAPDWVFSPSLSVAGHFSASACVEIVDSNQMQARKRAMDLAREEIALFLKGFDPASDVSNEVLPKVYLSDSVEWQRDDESLQFCVLASMNYQDLQAAENKFGRTVDTAEIEERFTTLTLLSEKGQEREMLADMQEIELLEKKRRGWIDENTALENVAVKNIAVRPTNAYQRYSISGTFVNKSDVSFSEAVVNLNILVESRPFPIASESALTISPFGGAMAGDEVKFTAQTHIVSPNFREAINRLEPGEYQIQAIVETLYGPGGQILAMEWDLDELSTSPSMRRLQSLKAKWSLPQ